MSASRTTSELDARKRELRRAIRARLQAVAQAELTVVGAAASAHLTAWLQVHAGPGPVALFAARPFEIDTDPLDDALRASGRVRLLPAIHGDTLLFHAVPPDVAARDLPRDRLGIPTPPTGSPAVPLAAAILVVVPACAVDVHGRRLGWGKGFYDRALSPRRADGCARGTVALVHDLQLVDEVPAGPGDIAVERLCTAARGLCDAVP